MIIISATISLIAILLSRLLGRRNPVRSSGLTSGMLVLLMFTPLLFILPKIEVSWLTSDLVSKSNFIGEAQTLESGSFSLAWLSSLSSLWMAGTAVLLIRLLIQCRTVKRWCREAELTDSSIDLTVIEQCAEQLKLTNIPEIRYTTQLESPVITGLLNPVLLLPKNSTHWSQETLKMVILHELGHFQRKDLWTNMAAHISCALHWFNPLVWMLRKRLLNECEYACDAHVIAHGANAKAYIHALCDVAENCRQQAKHSLLRPTSVSAHSLAMANQASLRNRVANVLDGQPKHSRWIVMGILALSASATLAYTLLRPQTFDLVESMETSESVNQNDIPSYSAKEVNQRLNANPFPAE